MGKYKVLIFEGKARQSLPLARAFNNLGCEVTALCQSKLDLSYVSRYVDKKVLGVCSNDNETGTIKQLLSLLKTGHYDLIVPTTDFSAMILSKYKARLSEFCKIASNDWDVFIKAADKKQTMEICTGLGIPCPKTLFNVDKLEDIHDKLSFPIVVKPKTGYGAMGFHKVEDEKSLKRMFREMSLKQINEYVFQEYIPQTDIQYECAMFIDNNNQVKTGLVFSKNRWFPVEGRSSTLNITVNRPDIVESCAKLLQAIKWRGAADIDLIQDPRDGKAKIMEINPRVSGSVKIAFIAGVNQALQMKEMAEGKDVTEYKHYKTGCRLRCLQTDFLWFIKSPQRFSTKPSWFSWKNTKEQIFSWKDPIPWFVFSVRGILNYRKEMEKRR